MLTNVSFPFGLQKPKMIEVVCNDRLGKKVRVKCKYPFTVTVEMIFNDVP